MDNITAKIHHGKTTGTCKVRRRSVVAFVFATSHCFSATMAYKPPDLSNYVWYFFSLIILARPDKLKDDAIADQFITLTARLDSIEKRH
jgi:hypothetical protein